MPFNSNRAEFHYSIATKSHSPNWAESRPAIRLLSDVLATLHGSSAYNPSILTAVKREKFAKIQENDFKGKLVTFTVQSLILYQYPVDLLSFLELY